MSGQTNKQPVRLCVDAKTGAFTRLNTDNTPWVASEQSDSDADDSQAIASERGSPIPEAEEATVADTHLGPRDTSSPQQSSSDGGDDDDITTETPPPEDDKIILADEPFVPQEPESSELSSIEEDTDGSITNGPHAADVELAQALLDLGTHKKCEPVTFTTKTTKAAPSPAVVPQLSSEAAQPEFESAAASASGTSKGKGKGRKPQRDIEIDEGYSKIMEILDAVSQTQVSEIMSLVNATLESSQVVHNDDEDLEQLEEGEDLAATPTTGSKRKATTTLTSVGKRTKAADGTAIPSTTPTTTPTPSKTKSKHAPHNKPTRPAHLQGLTHAESIKATKALFHPPTIPYGDLKANNTILQRYPEASFDHRTPFHKGRYIIHANGTREDQEKRLVLRITHPATGVEKIVTHQVPNDWNSSHAITVLNRWRSQASKRYTQENKRERVFRYEFAERRYIAHLATRDAKFIGMEDTPRASEYLTRKVNKRFSGVTLQGKEVDEWRLSPVERRDAVNAEQKPRPARSSASVWSEYARHAEYKEGLIPSRRITVELDPVEKAVKKQMVFSPEEKYESDEEDGYGNSEEEGDGEGDGDEMTGVVEGGEEKEEEADGTTAAVEGGAEKEEVADEMEGVKRVTAEEEAAAVAALVEMAGGCRESNSKDSRMAVDHLIN